jgi:hypothetical protein
MARAASPAGQAIWRCGSSMTGAVLADPHVADQVPA